MQYAAFSDKLFVDYIKQINVHNLKVIFANEEYLKRFHFFNIGNRFTDTIFIEHPNPDAINAFQLLYLFVKGAEGVFLQTSDGSLLPEHSLVNSLIEQLFDTESFVRYFDLSEKKLLNEKVSGESKKFVSIEPEYRFRSYTFSVLLKGLFEEAQKDNVLVNDPTARFCNININREKCSLCLACANVCNVGAMKAKEEDFSLRFTPSECTNCRLCVELCPEKAIDLITTGEINRAYFEEKTLAQDEPLRCKRCGKVFGNKRVFDEVKKRLIAAGIFAERGRFLDLCEDCRVIAMFEDTADGG